MTMDQSEILNKLAESGFIDYVSKLSVDSVLVFGSVLTNEFTEESDIDIAILKSSKLKIKELLQLESFLEDLLNRNIDVIDLRSETLDIFIKIDILNNGKVLYSSDNNKELEILKDETDWYYRENEHYFECRKRDLLS